MRGIDRIEAEEDDTRARIRSDLHIEARDAEGRLLTNIPGRMMPDIDAAMQWFVSEVATCEHAPEGWASAKVQTVTLTWRRAGTITGDPS